MREAVFNDVDEHYPCCNEQCHGAVHYLAPDERMGEIATAVVTARGVHDEDGRAFDIYVNEKFVQRVRDEDDE